MGIPSPRPCFPSWSPKADTLDEAYANVSDALAAVLELYAEQGRALPQSTELPASGQIIWTESPVEVA